MTQLEHRRRWAAQWLSRPDVAIVGGYHGGNLGDMALALAVSQLIPSGLSYGVQTIYSLERWPKARVAIVGGGAVGYSGLIKKLISIYPDPSDMSLLGVDFNDAEYDAFSVRYLQQVGWISCRSLKQAQRMASLTGRSDICNHADLAFSLGVKNKCSLSGQRQPVLLVNVVPLYGSPSGGGVVPNKQFLKERPDLYEKFDEMHAGYRRFVRSIVSQAVDEGKLIETAPFTPEDEIYGKIILKGLPVSHVRYHSNVERMLQRIRSCDSLLATRYHATIFGIKSGVNLIPFAYSKKNVNLLEELGVHEQQYYVPEDFCRGVGKSVSPVRIDQNVLLGFEDECRFRINECVNRLQIA